MRLCRAGAINLTKPLRNLRKPDNKTLQALDRVLPQHDDKGLRVKALVDSIKNPASLAQPMVPQHAHAYVMSIPARFLFPLSFS